MSTDTALPSSIESHAPTVAHMAGDRDEPELARLIERVRAAADAGTPLRVHGADTKRFYGRAIGGEPLDTTALRGITSYEPSELVVTARCGTPIVELEAALAERGQCLAFEPPRFEGGGTVGGMLAAGLSGPARATAGAVRDHVLGASLLNGKAQVLRFGGQVIKNVAGYDVSRLLAGSLGTLGVVLQVSLRVAPGAPARATLRFALNEAEAVRSVNRWLGLALPVHASAWQDGALTLRLQGAAAAVDAAIRQLGGERVDDAAATVFWDDVRDQRGAFFHGAAQAPGHEAPTADTSLWRLSVPPTAGPLALEPTDSQLIEWHGGLRWVRTHAPARHMFNLASRAGGHATLFRPAASEPANLVFAPLDEPLDRIHRALRAAFDPAGIFNSGRMYPG